MAEVSAYNKGGIPGQPPQNKPVNRSSDVAQTGGVKSSQKVQRALEQGTEQTAQVVLQKLPTIARRMTPRDVVNQLIMMGIRPNADNRSLALKMLMFGLELSKENFSTIESLLSGINRNSYTEQAAIILTGKDLPSRTAVQQLAEFLQNNPQLSQQLTELLQNANSFQNLLAGQNLLSSGLTIQLSAILSSLEGFITMLPQDIKVKMQDRKGLFSKAELLTNMRAFRSLLNGISKQVEQTSQQMTKSDTNGFLAKLNTLSNKAKDVAENIIVQAILSKPGEREDSALQEKYSYWQIPNSMATPPQTVELLVRRDKKDKNRSINPRKTKLVIKTETEKLGELAVEVEVEDDNLDFRFNTNDDETRKLINENIEELKNKLAAYNYKTKSVRVIKRNLDVQKFLIPTLDLNNLTRVQTEV